MREVRVPTFVATITVVLKVKNNLLDAKAIAVAIRNQVTVVARSAANSTAKITYEFDPNSIT